MENVIRIPFLVGNTGGMSEISERLDTFPKTAIKNAPWAEFPYTPDVRFVSAWAEDSLILKFYVSEEQAIARHKKINDPVYEDSCVEFFISAGDGYYNFEFNCEGVCLAEFGTAKTNRVALPESSIKRINVQSKINRSADADDYWELCVAIPFELFNTNKSSLLRGGFKANFYKCGDNLPRPHFLCWNNISTPEPNFHVPEFFGQVYLQPN